MQDHAGVRGGDYTVSAARPKEAEQWRKMGVPISPGGRTLKMGGGFGPVKTKRPSAGRGFTRRR